MTKKHCRNFQPTEYGARTLQTTDKQTTDGRAYIKVSSRSLKFVGAPRKSFPQGASDVVTPLRRPTLSTFDHSNSTYEGLHSTKANIHNQLPMWLISPQF